MVLGAPCVPCMAYRVCVKVATRNAATLQGEGVSTEHSGSCGFACCFVPARHRCHARRFLQSCMGCRAWHHDMDET